MGALGAAECLQHCLDANLPVLDAATPFITQVVWLVLQIDTAALRKQHTTSAAFRARVGAVLFAHKASLYFHRVLLVGPDIDIWDEREVIFAFSTRCRPGALQETRFEDVDGFSITPFMVHGPGNVLRGGKVVHDCLMPVEYTTGRDWKVCSFQLDYPKEVRERINERWRGWGFSG